MGIRSGRMRRRVGAAGGAIGIALLSAVLLASGPVHAQDTGEPETEPMGPPAPGPSIEGIVLNYTGGGVQDALVTIEDESGKQIAETRTNATGEFAIYLEGAIKAGTILRIRKEGYVESVQKVEPPEDEEDTPYVDVVLEGANILSGTVRAKRTGKPIEGAVVRCANAGQDQATKTDPDGAFSFSGIIEGPAHLTVIAEGYAIQQRGVKNTKAEKKIGFKLEPQRTVQLTVTTADGAPAEGVLIEGLVEPEHHLVSAISDARGRATLNGVGGDSERIRIRMNGEKYVRMTEFGRRVELPKRPTSGPADLSPVRKNLIITIAAGVCGKVIAEQSGEPVVGARIVAGPELSSVMPMTWTGMEGTYELIGLPTGKAVITCQHGDHAPALREVELTSGQLTPLDLKLGPGRPLGGQVVDESGTPVTQVWIVAERWQGYRSLGMRTNSDEEGRFMFPHAPGGDLEIGFFSQAHPALRGERLKAGRTDYRIVLKGAATAAVEIEEKLKIGEEVPDFTVTTTSGATLKLSALRGKYVFIDCWASWCGPCMAEVPNLKALHKAVKSRPDFVLLGISLDHDEAAFKKAASGMDWPQAFGAESGTAETFEMLEGYSLPYTCLIGPDGKLLAQRLRGPQLAQEVQKLLK